MTEIHHQLQQYGFFFNPVTVWQICSRVSEEYTVSVFSTDRTLTLKMSVAGYSVIWHLLVRLHSVTSQKTSFNVHCCENLKSQLL